MMELLIQNKVKLTANSLPTVDFSFSILGDHYMDVFFHLRSQETIINVNLKNNV